MSETLRFVDLFAGLGGFHLGLRQLGHECVFASELDSNLRSLYHRNFDIEAHGDIRDVSVHEVPPHDVLCAGFPCQPYSKAGEQRGLECGEWGDLFGAVTRIARHHKSEYLILENVANLERHDGGRTWEKRLRRRLTDAGYDVKARLLSPHQFGVPQIRPRFFIVAARSGLDHFVWPEPTSDAQDLSVRTILDKSPAESRKISSQAALCLDVWQDFLDRFPRNEQLPSFPIWSMEFGATYPYEDCTPHAATSQLLARRRGSHGIALGEFRSEMRASHLPSYARVGDDRFPSWKIAFIRQNRELYNRHHLWIDDWLPQILQFPSSLQKLEWNCKGEPRDIRSFLIQFRASGVRLKRPNTAPTLVAMTTTQVPIIGWEERYMTPRECSRLQCLDELEFLPEVHTRAFKALGNAVNAKIVRLICERLCSTVAPVKELVGV